MRYVILLISLILSLCVYGQKSCKIAGVVKDVNNRNLQGATIRLLSVPDSTFIIGTQTDASGMFSLDVSIPNFIMEIKLLGFRTLLKQFKIDMAQVNQHVGEILLDEQSYALKEVSITGSAPAIITKGDTIEYNTSIYSLPEYASVRDLLKILPNVTVSNSGIIMVQGKEVKKILVDGREFFSGDPELASKALPSKIVNKVQVVDRASVSARLSGFDNEKKETIINLEVKKEMKTAVMANANVGGGLDIENKDVKYENNAYINLMRDKCNFTLFMQNNNTNNGMEGSADGILKTGQIGLNISNDYSDKIKLYSDIIYDSKENDIDNKTSSRNILGVDDFLYDNSRSFSVDKPKSLNVNSRFEWKPNDKNTLFIKVTGLYNTGKRERTEKFESLNNALDTLYNGKSDIYSKNRGYNLGLSVDYAHNFVKKKGRIFSLSFIGDINKNRITDKSVWHQYLFENKILEKDSLLNQSINNRNRNRKLVLSLSYVEPISKRSLVQLLYKFQESSYSQDRITYDMSMLSPEEYIEVINGSQSISSRQNTKEQWFTLNFKSSVKKMTYILGANMILNNTTNKIHEPYSTSSGELTPNSAKLNTILYSPTFNFKYAFTDKKILKLDYQGLMTPPSPTQTQDYVDSSNPTNNVKGNPNLKPQFSNKIVASYSGSNPKKQIYYSLSILSQFIVNDIRPVTDIDISSGIKTTTYKNFKGNWNVGVNSVFNLPLVNKDYKVGNSLSFFVDKRNSEFNNLHRTMKRFTFDERPHIRYYKENFDFKVEGIFSYTNAKSNVHEQENIETYDWGSSLDVSVALPYKIRLGTTLRWVNKKGYGAGYNYSETILNGMLSKRIFSSPRYGEGMIKFAINDILQNRRNSSLIIGDNYYQSNASRTLGCYFIGSIIYNFNFFPNAR